LPTKLTSYRLSYNNEKSHNLISQFSRRGGDGVVAALKEREEKMVGKKE